MHTKGQANLKMAARYFKLFVEPLGLHRAIAEARRER